MNRIVPHEREKTKTIKDYKKMWKVFNHVSQTLQNLLDLKIATQGKA